jgi:predicted secreted protein with PEFG-CTERM motif
MMTMKPVTGAIIGILALTTILVVSQPTFAQYSYNPPPTTPSSPSNAVPEFGPVASLVLAFAIMSIVVFAAKTRLVPRI